MSPKLADQLASLAQEYTNLLNQPWATSIRQAIAPAEGSHCELLSRVDASPSSQAFITRLKGLVAAASPTYVDDGLVERFLLIRAAVEHLPLIQELPVDSAVQQALIDGSRQVVFAEPRLAGKLRLGHAWFIAACKIVTLRRYPAGVYEWEISGIPRSWLVKVEPRKLPHFAYLIGWRMRGLRPCFVPHLGILRPPGRLDRVAVMRAHHTMARALALQPAIKGMVGASWMRAPDIGRHSPHLAWLPQFFLDNGGFVADMGPADDITGVLFNSRTRRALHERGELNARIGLVVWPRSAMLRWAEAHPEFGCE